MTICCVFGCSNKPGKRPGITFHKFPKEVKRRKLWEIAVRRVNNIHDRTVICSAHFRPEDIDRTSVSCVRIREHAVPSLFPTFPKHLQDVQKPRRKMSKQRRALLDASSVLSGTVTISSEQLAALVDPSLMMICPAADSCDHSYATPDTHDIIRQMIKAKEAAACNLSNDPNTETSATNDPTQTTAKKRKANFPQGEIFLKRKLEDVTKLLQAGRKRIKHVLQQNRRLLKKQTKLKAMIVELKKRTQTREDRLTVLENTLPGASVDLLKLQFLKSTNDLLPASYSPQLKSFAMNLHFYSPRAYMYVRKAFNTCLPHPRTVTRWLKSTSTDGKPAFTAENIEIPLEERPMVEERTMVDESALADERAIEAIASIASMGVADKWFAHY